MRAFGAADSLGEQRHFPDIVGTRGFGRNADGKSDENLPTHARLLIRGDSVQLQKDLLQRIRQDRFQLLELDGVATDEQPGVGWEVFHQIPVSRCARFVLFGKMALLAKEARSAKGAHTFKPATLRFDVTKALQTVLARGGLSAPVSFLSRGILVDGKVETPKVKSTVTVTQGQFIVETRARR